MAQVVAGVTGLTVDGVDFPVGGSAKYGLGGMEATSIVGAASRLGSEYKGSAAFIEAEIYLPEGQFLAALASSRSNSTVVLTCLDRTVTLSFADLVGKPEMDAMKNSCTVRFEGAAGKEVGI